MQWVSKETHNKVAGQPPPSSSQLQFVTSSNQTTVFCFKFKEEKTKKCFHEVARKKERKNSLKETKLIIIIVSSAGLKSQLPTKLDFRMRGEN
jgi:hypothetical protein